LTVKEEKIASRSAQFSGSELKAMLTASENSAKRDLK
jgi:hypothetical protein